jgi:CubicO group peptidase (beta-lactamase class C family)
MIVRTALLMLVALTPAIACAQGNTPGPTARDLVGLWYSKLRFGPDVKGKLTIERRGTGWVADIAGYDAGVTMKGDTILLVLPAGRGSFVGRWSSDRRSITGHWIQERAHTNGSAYASPVTLTSRSPSRFSGDVIPFADDFTIYIRVTPRADGTVGAFIRNPERNLGRQVRADEIELDGETVRLLARRDSTGKKGRALSLGYYDDGKIRLWFRGDWYEFTRVPDTARADFYPRGRPTASYTYASPPERDDGWQVAPVEAAGIDREIISRYARALANQTIDSVSVPAIHGVLIARRGKLVFEEYFHGENRDKPHDTRSASKVVATTILGAAMQGGYRVSPETRVYETMIGPAAAASLSPEKRALNIDHLLTMSSGLDCDDSDRNSPGHEDVVAEQDSQPDLYKYILNLKNIRAPGALSVYCSINPHLAGGVISRAAGKTLPVLFHDLIARPMSMGVYHMNLTPTGDAYLGGGIRFLPRDFMKIGQLMLDDGKWKGRQILPPGWAKRASDPRFPLADIRYGYLWWVIDLPYRNGTVRGYFAGGNGGQSVMVIPELELVVASWGGNYADYRLTIAPQREAVSRWVLPAIVD